MSNTEVGFEQNDDRAARALVRERHRLATRVGQALQLPMSILGLVWLVLIVWDLTRGLPPVLKGVSYVIWALFVLQFLLAFIIAPKKLAYLRRNWLTALALLLPAFRALTIVRALRVLRVVRGARLLRVVASANRGMRALGRVMGRRGFGYVIALSLLVTVAGAAGMYAFEHGVPGGTLNNYGRALWWTAMILTTMGSDYSRARPKVVCSVCCSRCTGSRSSGISRPPSPASSWRETRTRVRASWRAHGSSSGWNGSWRLCTGSSIALPPPGCARSRKSSHPTSPRRPAVRGQ